MPYRLRILARNEGHVPVARLRERLRSEGLAATIEVEAGDEAAWDRIVLAHPDGQPIAIVEREPISLAEYESSEVAEFGEEIESERPSSAARWLVDYLLQVRVIYLFQVLAGSDRHDGWETIHASQGEAWEAVGGIMQADGEGFSNEDGYHILWQFDEEVDGPWKMAILGEDGRWTAFEMDLGDRRQREAFLAGRVPDGVRLLQAHPPVR